MTHEHPLQHHVVEGGVGSSGQKHIQLDQRPWVDVLDLGLLALNLLAFVMVDVHSHDGAFSLACL